MHDISHHTYYNSSSLILPLIDEMSDEGIPEVFKQYSDAVTSISKAEYMNCIIFFTARMLQKTIDSKC